MARFGSATIEPMIRKFGVPVCHLSSGVEYDTWGIVNEIDDEQVQGSYGGITSRIFEVLIKTGTLPYLAEGNALTVDGSAYTVVGKRLIDDGLVTRIFCTLD